MSDKALLLGINSYKRVSGLNGCVNDVHNMRKLLTEQLGFKTANIKDLLNENVVKSDVKKQMKWLLKDTQPGDRVVFHFSGHGSFTADLDGDEDDGADELICLYDMDFNDPETYLLDDELRIWTKSLPQGVELTIVMDNCHSGTGTRLVMAPLEGKPHHDVPMRVDDRSTLARALGGAGGMRGLSDVQAAAAVLDPSAGDVVRVRFIDPPPAIKAAVAKRKGKQKRGLVLADINHVLLAGCRSDQTAADATIGGSPNGAFTYHLCETIRTGGINLDRKELISRVEKALRDGQFSQVPQLETPSSEGPLFGAARLAGAPAGVPSPASTVVPLPSSIEQPTSLTQWKEIFPLIAGLAPEAQVEALRLLAPAVGLMQPTADRGVTAGARYLVYVHGICRHDAGYSNNWWNALHPFTNAFGGGGLNDTRREVIWSDLVNARALALQATRDVNPQSAREANEAEQAKHEILETLEDRADRQFVESGPVRAAGETPRALDDARAMISIPGLNCIDDFTVYMVNDSVRAQVIERFTGVVRPILAGNADVDIISHSWGTVVAYEGLRELAEAGLVQPRVRNFFTVGSALSIGAVKMRLRPANRDGRRPAMVRRWVNIDAQGDIVGGPLKGRPYQVDEDFPNVDAFQCRRILGVVNPACAHSSYFVAGNAAVNRDIFAAFIA